MNDIHSQNEWKYIPRWLTENFDSALQAHPIVVITGARQVGKSTFLQNATPTRDLPFTTLDDLDVLDQARRDPAALLSGKSQLVIDEIQKAPGLLSEIKKAVDQSQRQIRIVLSGSANLLLMEKVSETLAGRAVFITMDSMALRESQSKPPHIVLNNLLLSEWPQEQKFTQKLPDLSSIILKGLIPPVLDFTSQRNVTQWWEGYVTTFLERDLRTISRIDSLPDFRRLMTALALRSGQIINQTEISRDVRIPQPTLHRYLNMLEVMCLLYRVPAYAVNQTKRLIKSPKIYWNDTGLAAYLCGYYDRETLVNSREWGGLFETLIYLHLRVWSNLQIPKARLYYWRTTTGKEVDFIIEQGRRLLAIEVKASDNVRYSDLENLKLFINDNAEMDVKGVLVHSGSEIKRMDENIVALPWYELV